MNPLVMCRVCGNRRDTTNAWSRIMVPYCSAQGASISAASGSTVREHGQQFCRANVVAWRKDMQISVSSPRV